MFVEFDETDLFMCYPLLKEMVGMPHKIILDDIFEDIFEDISYIKLNSYIQLNRED